MKIQSTDEVIKTAIEFGLKIMELQLQKKVIDDDIKELKEEYKEEGVAVGTVNKVIVSLKAKAKKTEGELLEEEILQEKLDANEEIQNKIQELIN